MMGISPLFFPWLVSVYLDREPLHQHIHTHTRFCVFVCVNTFGNVLKKFHLKVLNVTVTSQPALHLVNDHLEVQIAQHLNLIT